METKDVLYELRTKHELTQDELAEKVFVTRQDITIQEIVSLVNLVQQQNYDTKV